MFRSGVVQFFLEREMRHHFFSAALLGGALGALAVPGIARAQNLLTNGNLDDTYQQLIIDNPDPQPDLFLPKPNNWTNTGTRVITGPYEDEMSSETFAGGTPTPATNGTNATFPPGAGLDAGVFFKAFTGNAANGAATAHLFQDKLAVPGATYTLTGWAGAEANYLAAQSVFAVEFFNGANVKIGGNELNLTPTLFVDNGLPFDYKQYSVAAVAPAGTVFVRARVSMIDGIPNPAGGGQAFVVDDFSLVPEPSSAALLLLGLAPLARRRR
jgi:hypothetical protein